VAVVVAVATSSEGVATVMEAAAAVAGMATATLSVAVALPGTSSRVHGPRGLSCDAAGPQ